MVDLLSTYLMVGDLLGFAQAVFTGAMGSMYYAFVLIIVTVPLYLRTQSLAYVSIVAIIFGSAFTAILPEAARHIAYLTLLLGVSGVITYLYTRLG